MLRGINRQDIFEDDLINRTDPMIPFSRRTATYCADQVKVATFSAFSSVSLAQAVPL